MAAVQLRPHPDVVWRRLENDVVLVHLKTNRIYSLNGSGGRLWELLSEGADRETAERRLLEEFEVGEDDVRRDVDRLLVELCDEGLLA
jgi:hypothetical protein